jgi:hypothetical protein
MTETGSALSKTGALMAHEAFYKAFAARDLEAMEDLWALECAVTCLHPHWPPLFDRRLIIESWSAIFDNTKDVDIKPHDPRYQVNDGWLIVVCYEELRGQWLAASNIYVWEGGVMKIAHHQAGPTSGGPVEDTPTSVDTVH